MEDAFPYRPDFVVAGDDGRPLVVVEASGREEDHERAATQIVRAMKDLNAPFGLIVGHSHGIVLRGDLRTTFSSEDLFSSYGLVGSRDSDFDSLLEEVVYNWLIDLTFGIARRPAPEGLPDLTGDDVRRAA